MSSKTRKSFAQLTKQVRAACGPILPANDQARDQAHGAGRSNLIVDLYRQFLVEPSADRYHAALTAFASEADDAIPSLLALEQAFYEGRYETVGTLGRQWQRHFALSPRFHRLVSLASLELGDQTDAEVERFAASACLEGILNSGNGSSEAPYLLSHGVDAQEVLAKLGYTILHQSVVEQKGKLCDVFEVAGDLNEPNQVWFELCSVAVRNPPARRRMTRSRPEAARV